MFSKKDNRIFRTLTSRLTVLYSSIFILFALIIFVVFNLSLWSSLISRADEELREDAAEIARFMKTNDIGALQAFVGSELTPEDRQSEFLTVLSPGLDLLASSDLSPWPGLDVKPAHLVKMERGKVIIRTVSIPGREDKARVIYHKTEDGTIIQTGFSLEKNQELLHGLWVIFGLTAITVLFFGLFLGWLMARRAMSGVILVTEIASQIGKDDLDNRVPPGKEGEEIENLASAFNGMLGRIESLVKEIREVTHNVAHDLRGPITRIRVICETTLASGPAVEDFQSTLGIIIDECDRLTGMINTLLEIAETDAGVAEMASEPVELRELVRDAFELFQPLAEDKGIDLCLEEEAEPLLVEGDRPRLQRVVANLLDNAIKYTPSGGKVSIIPRADSSQVMISISDSGIGIEKEALSRIFERFYRGEKCRSTPGNGLGLSLAESLARAHGGWIEVTSSPDRGSEFIILLPRSSSGPPSAEDYQQIILGSSSG